MSAVKTLKLPANISLFMKDSILLFKKDKMQMCVRLPEDLIFSKDGSTLMLALRNETTEGQSKILLGTWMNILSNILYGLSRGFHTNLLLSGVGFRAQKKDNTVEFKLGYSHLVNLDVDPNVKLDIFKNTSLHLQGVSKEQVGNYAARIKHLRLPDAYKGKGIRARGENLRLKEGKKT
jgi:large subunit ribosomal protein L6